LEHRADVVSIEALHQERRRLVEENGKLLALYGPFGHYDDHRKHMVEALKIKARLDLKNGGEKTTEAMIDAHAYGSDDYARFIDGALTEKIAFLNIANRITEIEEQIRDREQKMRAYTAELTLR
jgi:hypothetical protein